MKGTVKPVIAFCEDVDTWIYFDQAFQVFRYEIYCVGYDASGSPQTLEFVVEEGILPASTYPEISPYQADPTRILPGLIHWQEYMGFLPQQNVNHHPLTHGKLSHMEQRLKHHSRQRITKKLQHLGYDVIHAAS